MSISSVINGIGPDHWGRKSRDRGNNVGEHLSTDGNQAVDLEPIAAAMADTETQMHADELAAYLRPGSIEFDAKRSPVDDIAALMRSLTYGEMIELAGAIWQAKGDKQFNLETLPSILHVWQLSHLAKGGAP